MNPAGEYSLAEANPLQGRTRRFDSGGDVEVGVDVDDFYLDSSRTRLALFVSDGAFSKVYGGRLSVSKYLDNGHWDVFYELSDQDQENFDDVDGQILQHRIRGTRDFYTVSGWNVSIFAETYLWDDEDSYSIGFYIQKSF